MLSLQGHLLIASPHLGDPNFARSVVLVVEHKDEGALGLVLNHPSSKTISDVWETLTGEPCDREDAIYLGGPLEGPLMAIHTTPASGESQIVPGLWFSTHRDQIDALVKKATTPFRLFSGYSGWGEGQLDGEMDAGGWLTLPATADAVFATDDDELWQMVVRRVGSEILKSDRQIREWPEDPSLN
jgi:putative transcriptional regulator